MDWVLENKEWLFSGLAIALITLPISIARGTFTKKKNSLIQKSGNNSTNIQVNGDLNIKSHKDTSD